MATAQLRDQGGKKNQASSETWTRLYKENISFQRKFTSGWNYNLQYTTLYATTIKGVNIHWNAQVLLIIGVGLGWFFFVGFFLFLFFSYQKTGFFVNVDSNFSTFTLQRFTNVQLYSQKYVPLLGYIIDTDQTSKQENTTNLYICKVYTKYTLYIYRSKTKAELGLFSSC